LVVGPYVDVYGGEFAQTATAYLSVSVQPGHQDALIVSSTREKGPAP
jgi:hypothetical protein